MNVQEQLSKITEDILEHLKDELLSIILYGSAVRGEYVEKKSDINLLIIVDKNDLTPYKLLWNVIDKLNKTRINLVIMSPKYITKSLDTFPLEFLDMLHFSQTLYGKPIDNFVGHISKNSIRLACERELKVKLIALKSIYLRSKGKSKEIENVLFHSLTSLRVILLGLNYLKKGLTQSGTVELSKDAEIDTGLIRKINELRKGDIKLKSDELLSTFEHYITEMELLANWLDDFKFE